MILQRLRLHSFRVYSEQVFQPEAGLNLLIGPNGSGKTAILEALHLLSAARSFRARREAEVVMWGHEGCRIEGVFQTDGGHSRELSLSWRRQNGEWKKQATFQRDEVARLADFLGCVPLSLFTPNDLSLVNGSPSVRRKYLDLMLSKMYPLHLQEMSRLKKVISSRNALLRQERPWPELRPWNKLLFELTATVGRRREELVGRLGEACREYFSSLTGLEGAVKLQYRPCWPQDEDEFHARLEAMYEREKQVGSTLLSPQKDELGIHLRGKSLRTYGSQGEQRLVALCLRLSEAGHLAEHKNESAILLLDDAFSELDPERRERLLHLLPTFSQVILTSATPVELATAEYTTHQIRQGEVVS
jgi:DNA replication and repair protein RecF